MFKSDIFIENIKLGILMRNLTMSSKGTLPSELHFHAGYEVHYILSGEFRFTFEQTEFAAVENTLVVIAPQIYHRVFSAAEGGNRISFELTPSKRSSGENLYDRYVPVMEKIEPYMKTQVKLLEFYEMENVLAHSPDSEWRYTVQSLVICIFFKLANLALSGGKSVYGDVLSAAPAEHGDSLDTRIEKILSFVSVYYNQPITTQMIAWELNLSVRQTDRIIREKLHTSFLGLLHRIRIKKAQEEIRNGNSSMQKIAADVGYETYSHFLAQFKKHTGLSPSMYRKHTGNRKKQDVL